MLPNPEAFAEPTPVVPAPAASPAPVPAAPVPVPVPAPVGAKTPNENLKAALDEERLKRQQERDLREVAEARVKQLEEAAALSETVNEDDLTPGEKALKKQIDEQNAKLLKLTRDREMDRVVSTYPALQDKRDEFETFCADYPSNTGREKLAKLFLADIGLLEQTPVRKGLEHDRRGPREVGQVTKFTAEEIDRMMKNEPRRFNKLISLGLIGPDDLPK